MNRKRMNGIGLFAAIISIMLLQINISSACDTGPSPNVPSQTQMCGGYVRLSWVGTPPANTLWYWQDTVSNGTSTAYPFSVYTVTTPGTYYLRSRGTNNCWWGSVSVMVTAVYPQTYPSAPGDLTVQYPACGTAQITATGTPPANETWYWQTSCTGTSINNPYTGVRTVTASATYYLRARHNNSTCWATGCKSIAVTIKTTPGTPAFIDAITPACGSTALNTDPIPIPPVVWYWQGTDANGTRTDLGSVPDDYMATATGTYYLRAYNSSNPPSCAWSVASRSKAVVINPLPAADAGADVTVISGNSTTIGSTPVTGNTYAWSPATGLDNPAIANPVATPTQTTNYILTVTDASGCSNTNEVTVTVQPFGNTCNEAISHTPTTYCESIDYQISSTEMWLKFIADTTEYLIRIMPSQHIPNADIRKSYLYIGICSNLQEISHRDLDNGDSVLNIYATNLQIGTTYYIKVEQQQLVNSYFSLCIKKIIKYSLICPPPPCDLISNGDFNVVAPYSGNSQSDEFFWNEVCEWHAAWGSPQLLQSSNNNYAYMFHDHKPYSITGEGIYTEVNILNGAKYTIEFNYRTNNLSGIDHLMLCFTNYNFSPQYQNYVKPNYTEWNFYSLNYITQYSWTKESYTFFANGNYNKLVIYPLQDIKYSFPYLAGLSIDDVAIKKTLQVNISTNSGSNEICSGESINLICSPSGGVSYSWSDGTITWQTGTNNTFLIAPPTTSTFTVTVTDANGCTGTDDIEITVNPIPIVDAISDVTICEGDNTTLLALIQGGTGTPPFTYSWSPATGLNNPAINNPVANPTVNTTYIVTVTDVNSCTGTDDVVVTVIPIPDKSVIENFINNNCDGNTLVYNLLNPQAGVTYTWSATHPTAGVNITPASGIGTSVTVTIGTLNDGDPPVELTIIADINSCQSTATYFIYPCCVDPDFFTLNNYNVNTPTVFDYTYTNTKPILINGKFTVNANVTFDNIPVAFGSDAKIVVMSNYTLTIDNSDLYAKCYYMWDGIYVKDPTAKLIIENSSTVKDAKNAVVSERNGQLELTNSIFVDNYKDVVIHPGSDFYSGYYVTPACQIYGNTFTSTGYLMPQYPPVAATQTKYGIDIDSAQVSIGMPGNIAFRNTFSNMDAGIHSFNSSISVFNNAFNNITGPLFGWGTTGYGIYASSTHPVTIPTGLQVGAPSIIYGTNYFTDCTFGVYAYGLTHLISVDGNSFTNGSTAVWIDEYIHPYYEKHVEGNTITNYNMGIRVENANNTTINSNTISSIPSPAFSVRSCGVRIEGCTNTEIYDNDITGSSTDYRIEGISADVSPLSTIRCNRINTTGRAIFCGGDMYPSGIKLNKMNTAYDGFFLNWGYVGPQGEFDLVNGIFIPSDNEWLGTFGNSHTYTHYSDGTLSPFFIRNTPNTTYWPSNMINAGLPYPPISTIFISPSSLDDCSLKSPIAMYKETAYQIVNDEIDYPVYNAENKWISKDHLYKSLILYDSLLIDTVLYNFKTQADSGTFGQIEQVNEKLLSNDWLAANQLNHAIIDTIITENSIKTVNDIYITGLTDINTLRNIAQQCPYEYGRAVYMARVLLRLTDSLEYVNECEITHLLDTTIYADRIASENKSTTKVYPNPANDELIIECGMKEGEYVYFEIYNLLSQRVANYKFSMPVNYISVDKLKQGIYTYKIIKDNKVIDKNKLVIIK